MSDTQPQPRRFPFLLTLSVLGNLVLLGLLAGIFLKGPHKGDDGRSRAPDRPGFELSKDDREAVRELMHASFEAGREAIEVRRGAEKTLAEVLRADPYNEEAARTALANLREADKQARDIVGDRMFEGLGELSSDQRALVAKLMTGNMDRRGQRGERLEKFRDRRADQRRDAPGEPPPPPE